MKSIALLSYVPYEKGVAMRRLKEELGWTPYPQKHYESIITRFYQGYILPAKFGIDKRRIHLSRLICSGQISREAALADLERSPYDPEQLASDKEFVAKKFGISEAELDAMLAEKPVSHLTYASDEMLVKGLIHIARRIRSVGAALRSTRAKQATA